MKTRCPTHVLRITILIRLQLTVNNFLQLSLRENPLVSRFVRDMIYDPPTLLELAARCIKQRNVVVPQDVIPPNLVHYLRSAQRCVNPRCKGMCF